MGAEMPGQHMSTIELAEELTALNFEQLSKDDIEQIQRLILDYSAVTLCGSVQPWGRMLTTPGPAKTAAANLPLSAVAASLQPPLQEW